MRWRAGETFLEAPRLPRTPRAVEEWLEAVRPEAIDYCNRRVRNDHDAEEATQEAIIRVLAGYPQVKELAEFRALLFTILNHLCTDLTRDRATQSERLTRYARGDSSRENKDPAAQLLGRELAQSIAEAFAQLPANQRLALYLCTHEQMSYDEIAGAMGKSLAEVKIWIHRGRKRVQAQLAGYLKDEGAE
jgi:RNA polymerase sigma-70 factor (ECF subfamily)